MVAKLLKISRRTKARVFQNQAEWKVIGGKKNYYRSKWEWQYALYLQFIKEQGLILEWLHEPHTFWFDKIKRGVRSYKPDFKITEPDGTHYWAEVKGFMDSKSHTKLSRFKRYYPKEKMVVIDHKWFINNHCLVDSIIRMNGAKYHEHFGDEKGNGKKESPATEETI